jgi:hypothetical protein
VSKESHELCYIQFGIISHDLLNLNQQGLGNFFDKLIWMIEINFGVFGELDENTFFIFLLRVHAASSRSGWVDEILYGYLLSVLLY